MSFFVLGVVLHPLHLLVLIILLHLLLVVLHRLIVRQRTAVEVRLVHLHWVHLDHVHVHHGAATAVWWSSCVRHSAESTLAMHANAEPRRHRPHLPVEIHHVQRVARHLLLDHHVGTLVRHHVIDGDLAFSAALLRGHWHVVRLVHRVLVTLPCFCFRSILRFLI